MNNKTDNIFFIKKESQSLKPVEEKSQISKPVEQTPQVKKEKAQEQKNLDKRKSLDR